MMLKVEIHSLMIAVNGFVYTEHVPPYPAQKMKESMKEYFRYFGNFVLGSVTVYYVC